LTYKKIIVAFVIFSAGGLILNSKSSQAEIVGPKPKEDSVHKLSPITTTIDILEIPISEIAEIEQIEEEVEDRTLKRTTPRATKNTYTEYTSEVFSVPFFSQFSDITSASWKKIGCGIASLAMLIEFYEPGATTVDNLLEEGIANDAYVSSAGWSHAGLIGLSRKYGLDGKSRDMAELSMEKAFSELKEVLEEGPVMVSVHYTFDPQNTIPHLVVINGVSDGKVFYNDPAEKAGGGSISIAKFQSSWKKRYIEIRASA
jgi:predicted double-glycine peptidase